MSSLVAAASTSGGSGNLLIFALPILVIVYMFFTQRRRAKESQKLQSELGVGDEVTTTSGLMGRIAALDDGIATLEVSPGVNIRFNRRAIVGPAPFTSGSSTTPVSPTESASSESATDTESDPSRVTD